MDILWVFFFFLFRAQTRPQNPSVKDMLFCPSSTYLILSIRSRFLSFPSSGDDYPTRMDGQCKRAILAKVKQEKEEQEKEEKNLSTEKESAEPQSYAALLPVCPVVRKGNNGHSGQRLISGA